MKTRLNDCIKIQEGDTPSETPEAVVDKIDKTLGEFQRLVYLINMTNATTVTDDGRNITALLAERDTLGQKVEAMNDALCTITEKEPRYSRSEIKYVRTVDVGEFRRLYDKSASALRQLDLRIQGLGFTTDLVE